VSNRRLLLGCLGIALIATGLLALWFPVYLGLYDRYGMQIGCGRGFSGDVSPAADIGGASLAGKCGTALLVRRIWAIPTAVIGWALLTAILAIWVHNKPDAEEESTRFWELRGDAT
jgi:hypothetical protein